VRSDRLRARTIATAPLWSSDQTWAAVPPTPTPLRARGGLVAGGDHGAPPVRDSGALSRRRGTRAVRSDPKRTTIACLEDWLTGWVQRTSTSSGSPMRSLPGVISELPPGCELTSEEVSVVS